MTEISSSAWPWITLVVAAVAFLVGTLFGRQRMLNYGGGGVCGAACDCAGANCAVPVGAGLPHVHCPKQLTEVKCPGTCTNAAGPGHAGPHLCTHGHTF